jgi:hypothetical protein
MTTTGDVLNQVIPALVRLVRRPGAALLAVAAAAVGTFAVLGLVHGVTGTRSGDWLAFACALLLAVPVVLLAVRRHRLQQQVAEVGARTTISGAGTLAPLDRSRGDRLPGDVRWEEEREAISAAMAENALRTARFLPRVEAAQRAARRAAGGTVQAPYLKDDIRVTLVALLGTIAAVPLAGLGALVTAIALLTR